MKSKTETSQPRRLKLIAAGPKGSGKSCLIKRYCEGKFVSRYITTIGVDYGVKPVTIDGTQARVNFWDLSGDPEYLEVRNEFYKDSQGVLLVFDLSVKSSFDNLEQWLEEMNRYGLGDVPIVVIGNKSDKGHAVDTSEAKRWASSHGMKFFAATSMTGENVKEAVEFLIREALRL